ncbi:retrovirus-related pol polyprotein from transposon TNT 1-94 [Tanacetum coccineum]|uniref:Retrovirus-related pol polyprotein from transposon TNT 1-94 n=1 Tax=Tanacetum coccineum TaxID=301880 RepID=A0ABQ5ITA6_9ASTR
MLAKQNDPIFLKKKANTNPINYVELNKLSEDFRKCFVPQQELSAEQAFWFHMSNPTTESSDASPVKVEVPCELPNVSLVNESLKKLKFHLAKFDSVVKKRTTPDALTEAQIQDKIFVITSLKNDLRKLKGKEIVDNAAQLPNVITIVSAMFKLDLDPLAPRLLQNREAHIDYLKYTQEQADILRGIVKQAKAKQPLDNALDLAFKKVRFFEPLTSSSNIKQVESSKTSDSNTPVLSSTGLKCSTSNCGSKPTSNKKNDRISQQPSRNMKNKVEAQPRKVNKKNRVVKPIRDADVNHSLLNVNSELICATCNKCMFDAIHDMCLLDFVKNVNGRSKSAKKHTKQNIWKPTGHVFTEVGFKWKPTGRTFTLVGNSCPLTRITSTKVVPIKESTSNSVVMSKPELKVYSRRPKHVKNVVQIVLWYLDSRCSKHMTRNRSHLLNFASKFLGTVRFRNDQIEKIMGYGDYQMACASEKSKKSSHHPKAKDTNQEKLYLLHMDLRGPMRVASINGKTYILMIVDDYSRFTWVRFLRTKDGAPEAIIKCIKNIQVRLNATVRNVRTDNETEFINQTLREFYENAEAINTACYTQNCSLIHLRYNTTPYELMHDKKPDLSFLRVFGSLCYPTNDSEDLGKLDAKANIGPRLKSMTPATSSSGLVSNPVSQQPFLVAAALRAAILADSLVSTSIDQDAPSLKSPKTPLFYDDPLHESLHEDSTSQGSSSNMRPTHTLFEHLGRWTRDHPIENVIRDPSRSVSTRKQLEIDAMWCYFYDNPSHVYKLKKALYGLKQAPRAWYGMLSSFLISQHFSKGAVDPTLFTWKAGNYLLLTHPWLKRINWIKIYKEKQVDATHYRGMIGSLMYLSSSRPDLIYVVYLCAHLWYSKDTDMSLTAYADTGHAGYQDTRRSTSGSA